MNHNDSAAFSAALRERVRDEDPDLDQLIQVSTRTGTRLRRRRTVGVSLAGAAAGVAVIGIVGASLGGSGTTGSEPGLATQPNAASSPSASAPPTAPPLVTAEGMTLAPMDRVLPTMSGPRAQVLPVHVAPSLKGWEIGIAADEKFPAVKGLHLVTVNVRPMSDYASWSGGDPDKPANQVAHVGDNYFVTVQPAAQVPQAVVDELVGALRFQPRWKK